MHVYNMGLNVDTYFGKQRIITQNTLMSFCGTFRHYAVTFIGVFNSKEDWIQSKKGLENYLCLCCGGGDGN